MPAASLGLCVWYPSPDDRDQAVPAVITQAGDRSVNLTVWAVDNRGGLPMSGVRHASDPEIREHPGYDSGCWDYTPEYTGLSAVILALKSRLDSLESELGVRKAVKT